MSSCAILPNCEHLCVNTYAISFSMHTKSDVKAIHWKTGCWIALSANRRAYPKGCWIALSANRRAYPNTPSTSQLNPPTHGDSATGGPCGSGKSSTSATAIGNSSSDVCSIAHSSSSISASAASSWRCLRCLRRANRSRRSAILRRRWSSATTGGKDEGQ